MLTRPRLPRRRLLATGIAALSLPRHGQAASVPDGWSLHSDAARYDIAVREAGIVCQCVDPAEGNAAAFDMLMEPDMPMATLRPGSQPIAWTLVNWTQPDAATLNLTLRGDALSIEADIMFMVDAQSGMLRRHTTLHHRGDGGWLDLGATLAFWLLVPERIEQLLYLAGNWAAEAQVRHDHAADLPLHLESRSGATGFAHQPHVVLRSARAAYVCQLLWSGNWALDLVPTPDGVVLRGGLNPWGFRHRLRPGNALRLPDVIFGRFAGGVNDATQRVHAWRRAQRPDPGLPIPVQFNSWYPYFDALNADAMLRLIPLAQQLGCEAFVVDAGWFRTDDGDPMTGWPTRTGDWRVSRSRFPNGLREIGAACQAVGLRFGLWFEPEVIGPLSAVRAAHPEWLHHIDGDAPARDARAVLNLGVPAAWQHVYDRVTRIVRLAGVGWMKWDFNADLGAGGWAPGLPESLTDADPLVAHYHALYRLQDAIRAAFPELVLEMCASGGGRMDGAILSHAHVNWISDQPGPLRKLAIHFGTQLVHPPEICNDWLIEWPPGNVPGYDAEPPGLEDRGDLLFRLRVAMLGSFGVSARVDRWSDADRTLAAAHIALYRARLRPIIEAGAQYFLTHTPPMDGAGEWAAIWYVASHGMAGVLFAFRLASESPVQVFALPGLQPERMYRLSWQDGDSFESDGATLRQGVTVTIDAMFRSALCLVEAV